MTVLLAVLSVPFALLVGASAVLAIRAMIRATRPPVLGNAATPPAAAPAYDGQTPAPGSTGHGRSCGCTARHADILDLLLWEGELKDRLTAICACGGTGWITTTAPDGTLTQQACRDCLGPGGDR